MRFLPRLYLKTPLRSIAVRHLCGLLLVSPGLVLAQGAPDDSSILEKVKGTVYARSLQLENEAAGRRCGFEFLVIARDPANGRAVQLKGTFIASQNAQGAFYGWGGVLYDGLRQGQAAQAPGRITVQPVNGMRIKQPVRLEPDTSGTLQYRTPVDADFQVLLASIVRDRGLKVGFSREPDGALIETMLDLDVSAMQVQEGRVVRQFDSRVPLEFSRCWGGGS